MDPRSSSGTSAYGSAGASGHFDPATFIRKPQVILRMVGVVSRSHMACVNVIFHPCGRKSTVMIGHFPSLGTEVYKHIYAIFRPQVRKSTAKFRYFTSGVLLFCRVRRNTASDASDPSNVYINIKCTAKMWHRTC